MASQAKSFGANAIINYSYKQEKKLFGWDSLSLVGIGTAIIISDEHLLDLKQDKQILIINFYNDSLSSDHEFIEK